MEDNNFILEFLEVYRSLPALWNIKSKEYSNRNLKNEQYATLLTKYKEKYPEATKKEVTQKINTLPTNYRRELKRISALERSGSGISENEPTLYYFDAMDFLRDNESSRPSRSSILDDNETQEVETPRKRRKTDSSDELIALAAKRLTEPRDEFSGVAQSWALKLKKMEEIQRIFAERFINEILFEGQMGTLHRNAMTLNVDSRANVLPNFSRPLPGNSSFAEMSSPHIRSSSLSIDAWNSSSEQTESFSPQNSDTQVSRYFSSFK